MVAIVSDFFDPAGIDRPGRKPARHAAQAVAGPARAGKATPTRNWTASFRWWTARPVDDLRVTVTPKAVEAYQQAYADFQDKLLEFAGKRRAGYITLNADGDVLEQFMNLFAGGVITTRG